MAIVDWFGWWQGDIFILGKHSYILEIILCGIKVYILRCIFFELNILERL